MLKYRTEDKDILLGDDAQEIVEKMAALDHQGNGGVDQYMERVRERTKTMGKEMNFDAGDYQTFLDELVDAELLEKLD